MDTVIVMLALATGFATGSLFSFLQIPIPAPPNLAGIAGILGIYLGFKLIEQVDVGFDLLAALGL
ncbi:XapX domain-containing protein [Haladaptatus sp. ZSTT2]|uniref:XapX domain-containing protein n=1 Tax=Haladaptatus sp. ZSTT2 TaxID=3120515 RepID=UPI00300E7F35